MTKIRNLEEAIKIKDKEIQKLMTLTLAATNKKNEKDTSVHL